jgi:hypothetical protein
MLDDNSSIWKADDIQGDDEKECLPIEVTKGSPSI